MVFYTLLIHGRRFLSLTGYFCLHLMLSGSFCYTIHNFTSEIHLEEKICQVVIALLVFLMGVVSMTLDQCRKQLRDFTFS